ncbi:MAG TPA: glycine cleavage system aminomethyltransferase GcvT [Rhodospirillaceae bacterium]|nr:glycine cleavage system aminomethyltransferase GcvT [Rhodospirillaceae bacterium]
MKTTPLFEAHKALGAKMGAFAGYDMPLYYGEGVIKEHEWVRKHTGLFDVSHMGQVTLEGAGAAQFFERLTPSSFQAKKPGRAQYTVLTNEKGGIIDDLIVTRLSEDKFFAVINAGCKEKDIEWMRQNLPDGLKITYMKDHALLALQGGWAERILHETFEINAHELPYMHLMEARTPYGTKIFVSRLGYTGEDGFELSVPADKAVEVWEALNNHPEVKPIGLAARDSLRLEMGYPLYGHDINEGTSPVEADLSWVIGKENKGFIGAARVLNDRENGPARKRVGIRLMDKGIAREGAEIRDSQDKKIGELTSGGFSPVLKESIGQGYIESKQANIGEKVFVNVRGRNIPAEVAAMPFVPARTKSMKKQAA